MASVYCGGSRALPVPLSEIIGNDRITGECPECGKRVRINLKGGLVAHYRQKGTSK